MHKLLIGSLLILSSTLTAEPQQVCSQFSIAIQNASFETPVAMPETFNCQTDLAGAYEPGLMQLGRIVPSWKQSAAPETAYPAGVAQWSCLPQQQFRTGNPLDDSAYLPPDGQNVAFLGDNLSISQDLGVPLQGGTYLLKFYIADWAYSYPGKLRASILVGQHNICSSNTWALGAWVQVALSCPVPGYLTYNGFGWTDVGNGNVVISFQHTEGWIVLLDEVSLTLTAPAFVHN